MVIGDIKYIYHRTILESIDRKEVTALVLATRFIKFISDSIDHVILFRKLQSINVTNLQCIGLKATCQTEVNAYAEVKLPVRQKSIRRSMTSRAHTVTRGVPQGSILGPLLFNIYIIDFPNVTKESSLESYVDDSKIFLSFPIVDAESAATKLSGI